MPPTRIKTKPTEVRDQLTAVIAGVNALPLGAWPASAPTVANMTAHRDALGAAIISTDTNEAAWKVSAEDKKDKNEICIADVQKADEALTLLYGKGAAEKNNFGITPEGTPIEALHKLIEIVLRDGPVPGSLFFDWESIDGASYEVQWSTTSNFAVVLGSSTSAGASEYVIGGLTPGTQYWARVRPVRGGSSAEWSDPATRVAPL